ncbi:MAG: pilus assembly protein PilP [Panacagrimonas sp.]
MNTVRTLAFIALLAPVLAGCGSSMQDLEQRVSEVKSRKSKQIEPIPQIEQFEAFAYLPQDRRDPFQQSEAEPSAQLAAGPRPDLNRSREPLEEFPLDALRMQGIIETPRVVYALVQAPDGVIHKVAVGNHLGQNYGQVKGIAESEITLAEIVPDGFGGWISRSASLALSE